MRRLLALLVLFGAFAAYSVSMPAPALADNSVCWKYTVRLQNLSSTIQDHVQVTLNGVQNHVGHHITFGYPLHPSEVKTFTIYHVFPAGAAVTGSQNIPSNVRLLSSSLERNGCPTY